MAKLTKQMFNYKNKIDVGKFGEYTFDQLIEVVNPDNFYFEIENGEQLLQFMQALHIGYCGEHNEDFSKLKYHQFTDGTSALTTSKGKPQVLVNKEIGELFDFMKACYSFYFPFYIFEITMHESNHVFQMNAVHNNNFDNLNYENKIGALHQAVALRITKHYNEDSFSNNSKINNMLCAFFNIDDLVGKIKEFEDDFFYYGNNPCEIAARDNAFLECEKLTKMSSFSSEVKKMFRAYLTELGKDNVDFAFNEKDSNYMFFLDLLKADLFEGDPEIKKAKQMLCSEIDKRFSSLGLKTIKQADDSLIDNAQKITDELYKKAELIHSSPDSVYGEDENKHNLSPMEEELAKMYDNLIENLFLKKHADYKVLQKQYFQLFPTLMDNKQRIKPKQSHDELLGDKNTLEALILSDEFKVVKKR